MHDPTPLAQARSSIFEEVIRSTMSMSISDIKKLPVEPENLSLAILGIVGAEWLTVIKYLTTRLTQIEWELKNPNIRTPNYDIEISLKHLHPWRHNLPVYHTMVNEVLQTVLQDTILTHTPGTHLSKLRFDFQVILDEIERLEKQFESVNNVLTALISIDDNKRALMQLMENRDLSRLTYLAVIFVPMSFVSSLFSMTPDLSSLRQTIWVYFAVSVPLTLLALSIAIAGWIRVKRAFQLLQECWAKMQHN
jgi:Mg2+ and Co2+ transporter CorA